MSCTAVYVPPSAGKEQQVSCKAGYATRTCCSWSKTRIVKCEAVDGVLERTPGPSSSHLEGAVSSLQLSKQLQENGSLVC